MPELLVADFPRKKEITQRYQAERERLNGEIATAEASHKQQAGLLVHVNDEIGRLSAVSARDFEAAMADQTAYTDKVNLYLLGSFAPWELMPDWFAQALVASGQSSAHLKEVTSR